jgi:tetratricopeptide (TPR) repeat protein
VKDFANKKREQIDAMKQELKKPKKDRILYAKYHESLTDLMEVNKILKKNIMESNPLLGMTKEMMEHPAVAQKLKAQYGDLYETQWEQAKLNFVLETITRLEDRKAADMALGMGMLPDMFSELMKITGELQITEAINQAMDNELKTSHMEKMILDWLKDIKRDLLIQGRIETAVNRAAQIVRRNLDAYRLVLQSRTKAEALFAEGMPRDPNDLRMLTGKYFLTGRYDEDTKTAQQWLSQIEAIKEAVSGELIEIKSQVIKNAKLDSDYDKDTLKKVVFRDVMRKAWSDVFKKSESQSWKEAATTWARVHYDERQRIVSDFKKYYSFKEIHVVIAIDPDPAEKEKQVTLTAKPNEKLRKIEDLIYQWFDDTRKIRLGEGEIVTTRFSDAGLHKIRLEVSKKVKEKREKLTDAIQDLEVREKPEDDKEKADKEKAEREKAQKERAEKEQLEKERREREQQAKVEQERLAQERLERERRLREAQKPKEPLACSYEYTEWGECSRQAKKQTRSVVAKKPEGCVEKGRPHLEQECIPPPTEAEKRQNLLNCLCWCTEGGYSYNPSVCAQGKLPGVCHYVNIGGADVCRVMNPRNQECVVECYQTHYGKKPNTDELAQINRDIRAENRKNMKPLKVTLAPDAKPIRAQYGDIVKITSSAEGGMPGYTYSWRGNGEGKDNTFTFINTRQPGSYSVAVTVNDSDGNSATASITILVEAISIKVEKTSPTTETIPVGTKAQFRATVMSGDRPASGDFNYLWQPHPEIEFNPFEKSATTTAIFRKPGTYSIFVQAFKKVGGIDSTVGESNQVTITVVNPKWRLDFSPQDPLIGQEVKAKILPDISPEPDMKEMNFRWQLPSNAKQRTTSQDDLEITFILTDTNPANISCLASTKYDNQNLGGAGKTIRAQGYQVTISEPRYLESPPQIWHCDTQFGQAQRCGMVTVKPNQFAVFRDIFLNATVTPPPDSPRYRWTIDPPGSCGFPGAGSEIKLNCSSTGTYTARVEVTNTEGAKLGEASQPVTISISQETLDNSKKAKEAYEKLQKAKELVSQGKLDEAISLAEEAAKLDPKNHEASTLSNRWRTEKQTIQSQLNKVNSLITQIKFNEAEKELSFAKNLHPKYQPVINTEALLREKKEFFTKTIVEKLGRAKDLFAQQKISEAIKLTEEVLTVAPQNNEARNLMQQFREAKIRDDKAQELINEAWNLEKNRRYDEALKKYKEGYALVPNPEVQKRIVNLENLGNQAKRLLNEGFSHEKQGNIDEALKKYKEAQGIYPDDGVARKIAELEQKDRQASQLLQEGYQFEKSGKFLEAITKYRQAYQIVPNQQIANKIIELEKAMGEQGKKQQLANQLRNEGGAFEQRRMYREAIEKYQSAQQIIPEDRTAQKIADLKGQLKQEEQQKEREEQVQQLVNRGYQQEKQGDLKGALEKYKEANRIIFNSKVAEHITDLENKLSKPPTVTAATPPPSSGLMSPPSAGSGGVDGTWEVSFNNYRGKMELKWAGDKWSGRLWLDAHQRWEDLTNISYSSTTGRLEFTRPNPGVTQRYSGVLSAERLEGTFTQENTSTKYTWWAKRTQGSTSTQGPTPPSGSGRIAEAAWLGMGDDKVGMENMDRPNGVKDGHFRVVMDLPVNTEVNYISIHYSNVNGDKREHYWFSKSYTSWILGVFRNNVMLNPGRRSPLGRFSGRTVFDLYANNSGVFLPGNYFLIEVEAGGVISTRLVQVSASTSTPPSPPPAIKPTSSRIDPTGTWRNNPDATWKFTMGTDGRYFAQETGLGYASGPAYFTSSGTFRIDYKTRDGGYTGYFEIRFAPDGRTGSGNWQQFTPTPQSKSNVDWTRLQ